MTLVCGPARAFISAEVPAAKILLPLTATPWQTRSALSTVMTDPFRKTKSAGPFKGFSFQQMEIARAQGASRESARSLLLVGATLCGRPPEGQPRGVAPTIYYRSAQNFTKGFFLPSR
jgi:hypothetical protein